MAFVRAGLWADAESAVKRNQGFTETVDWERVYRLAEEQSVIGVVLVGIELSKIKPPQELLLQWIGKVQMLEQQNTAMNKFIGVLVEKLRASDIYTLLVKGQGIAQCYERPLWRACGDVDFLFSKDNYNKAKKYLLPLSTATEEEYKHEQHLGMTIENWVVELHGSLRCGLSKRIDKTLDEIPNDIFYGGSVRSWMNGNTQVFLPGINEDVVYVFTHFLQHFYKGGLGIRQICDWCRLMWTYRDSLNYGLLESRIKKAGLMTEWKAFATLAVDYLGMPEDTMPFYDSRFMVKGSRLVKMILRGYTGNKYKDTWQIAKIFPWKTLYYSPSIFLNVN